MGALRLTLRRWALPLRRQPMRPTCSVTIMSDQPFVVKTGRYSTLPIFFTAASTALILRSRASRGVSKDEA